jgi:hypothetical protein
MALADVPIHDLLWKLEFGRQIKRSLLMSEPSAPQIPYSELMADVVGLFEALEIGYALIGGVAAMHYGRARFTEDLDFVADPDYEQKLARQPEAMTRYRFDSACTYRLYHASGLCVDLRKDEHARAIIQRAGVVKLAGIDVRIAEVHDLLAMKLRAGRVKDDYDISEIIQHQTIDQARLEALVSVEQVKHFNAIKARVG